jgi:hypothetical protein
MPQFVETGVPIKENGLCRKTLTPAMYLAGFMKEELFPKKLASIMEFWAMLSN